MNLADVFRINARNHPGRLAIRHDDRTLDYAEAWSLTERIAAMLAGRGVRRGDRVGLAMKDHPEHLLTHYSLARLGAVILPVDHRWTAHEKAAAAQAFDARLLLTDGDSVAGVDCLALKDELRNPGVAALPEMPGGGDLLLSLSSGTTGRPKGAVVTHANLYERFVSQWAAIGFDARDCFALATPLYFGAGRSFGMCMLAAGASVKLAPPPMQPEQLAAAVGDPSVTATFLPPTLLRRLLPLADDRQRLFENLNYLLVSGEPLYAAEAAEVRKRISDRLIGYYASSEGGGISVLHSADFAEHAATVGTPTFRTEVEIVDGDSRPVETGVVGRLRYRGPGVATRFVDSDGNERSGDTGGWFYPGDLAERLESGHLALRGRDKDVIIRGGVNVYPAEIEAALQQHAGVTECAVVARADADRGETVVACYAGAVEAAELEEFCRERLAPYKVPGRFVRLDELPKANSGKIDKKALAKG